MCKTKRSFIAAAFTLLLSLNAATADKLPCNAVSGVIDGDTLRMCGETIRMLEIDAPESMQPYGAASARRLADFTLGKQCTAVSSKKDQYGRTLAKLDCGEGDVGRKMVREGAAWVYKKAPHAAIMKVEEDYARKSRVGLWGLPERPVEPSKWRAGERTAQPEPEPSGLSCDTKKLFCSQMKSCDEARFYLQCGVKGLDKDMDGTPCEALCGQ